MHDHNSKSSARSSKCPFRLKIYVPSARYARIRGPVGRRATSPDRSTLVSLLNYLIKLIFPRPHTPHSRISENEPGGRGRELANSIYARRFRAIVSSILIIMIVRGDG